jgi:membrane-associated protease RseP (regulator of RpoE activity)
MILNKSSAQLVPIVAIFLAAAAGAQGETAGGESNPRKVIVVENTSNAAAPEAEKGGIRKRMIIEKIEKDGEVAEQTEVTRLGVSSEEASEVVAAQLGLAPGAGLLVPYIAPNSPAAKAGLQKNDVLVQFEGQLLVHPVQLRKLVQMHKAGDSVKLEFYRAGKKQNATAILDKTKAEPRRSMQELMFDEDHPLHLMRMQPPARNNSQLDKERLKIEIRQSVEDARKSVEEALKEAGQEKKHAKMMEELARSGVLVDKQATVTVGSSGSAVKTMVRSDDAGTYVLVADPKLRLTVHDKQGKLLFDGEIESAKQKEKIPAEIQEKVKPLLEEMNAPKAWRPKSEGGNEARPKNSSLLEIEKGGAENELSLADSSPID